MSFLFPTIIIQIKTHPTVDFHKKSSFSLLRLDSRRVKGDVLCFENISIVNYPYGDSNLHKEVKKYNFCYFFLRAFAAINHVERFERNKNQHVS
jgi:hypothetical protein